METAIQVRDLGKCFKFYNNRWQRLRGALLHAGNHAQTHWALRNVGFEIPRGTTFGIVGPNGSGKTTLLQLLAGLMKPTEGTLQVRGNLATLLELTGGFQTEFTGRENIFVAGGLRGFSKREVQKKIDQIIAFSELEEFIDRPVKHYSTGMLMRLAFATAINVEPDVLLIDEVFAVGDMAFQHKCTRKFRELQKKGSTIVLVTHDMMAVKSLCDSALLLDHGVQVKLGSPEDVTNCYLNLVAEKIAREALVEVAAPMPDAPIEPGEGGFVNNLSKSEKMKRHGSGEGKICGVVVLNSQGLPTELVSFGEEITFRFYLEYFADVPHSGMGFYVRDRYGNDVIGINTFEEQAPLGPRKKGDRLFVDFTLTSYLKPGSYSISPGFSYDRHEPKYLDWIDHAALFQMEKPRDGKEVYGFMHVPSRVSVRSVPPRT